VHNLRDLGKMMRDPTPLPYTISFDEALKNAVQGPSEGREQRMTELLNRSDAGKAHPTIEHLLPIYVGAGAAGADEGIMTWTLKEGCMSWGMFRFGDVVKM
jgi:4,5-DOPA dioxygenase extradiol